MKLRIQDDSVRFRLTRKEVAHLRDRGFVDCAVRFRGNQTLGYSVRSSPDAAAISVSYAGDAVMAVLPAAMAMAWAESNEITLEGSDSGVRILIEKDFQCLHQAEPLDPEAYPHPHA